MKKLVLKTAFITLGVTLIMAVSLFGIVSFCAPSTMMRFCESLGLSNISGDYAYQEYQNSKDLEYLAHAFEVAEKSGNYSVAEERFEELYGEDGSDQRTVFAEFCLMQNEVPMPEGVPQYDYRSYLCGRATCVKYQLALTNDEKSEVCAFAISETPAEMTEESPLISLALRAKDAGDSAFCNLLLAAVRSENKFNTQNEHYVNLIKILEEAVS